MSIISKLVLISVRSMAEPTRYASIILLLCLIFAFAKSSDAMASNYTYSTINTTIRANETVGWQDEIAVLNCLEALQSYGSAMLRTEDSHFEIVMDQIVYDTNLKEKLKAQAEPNDPKAESPKVVARRFSRSLREAKNIRGSMYSATRSLGKRGTPLLFLDNRKSTKVYATGYTVEPGGSSEGLSIVCAYKQPRPYDPKKDATKVGLVGALTIAEIVTWNYNIRN